MIEPTPSVAMLVDENVVVTLEKALAAARRGEIRAVAVALVTRDMSNYAEFCFGQPPVGMLMGSIERMRHKLNLHLDG
jgi:hypothetical protein